ncbi:MAG: hypothetical protein RIS75_1309 [Actinomycetota bacterium]|jgi:hypothetical protein
MRRSKKSDDQVHDISGARESLSVNQAERSRRYMWSMSIRLACFVAALWVDGPLRWFLLAGSLVLPWIAVVVANAGREGGNSTSTSYIHQSGRELH